MRCKLNVKKYLRIIWYIYKFTIRRYKLSQNVKDLEYIENGNYKVLISDRQILYKEEDKEVIKKFEITNIALPNFLWNSRVRIRGKKTNPIFCGQAFMMTEDKGCKLFDAKNSQVLSLLDKTELNRLSDIYEIFNKKILTAYLYKTDNGIVEKVIYDIPCKTWSEELILKNYLRILSDQLNYLGQSSQAEEKTCQDIFNEIQCFNFPEINETGEQIKSKIKSNYVLPCFFLHRDVHFGNTLFDGEDLYYIDFESAGTDIFIYDIFNCMYVEYVFNHRPLLLSLYAENEDNILRIIINIFNLVGIKFDEEKKWDYVYIFLLARLKRECEVSAKCTTKMERKKRNRYIKRTFDNFCNSLEDYYDKT